MTAARSAARSPARTGLTCGAAAYLLWGASPLYWPLVKPAAAVEILAHRMAWSGVFAAAVVVLGGHWPAVRRVLADPRRVGLLTVGAVLVSVNWGVYIWSVNHDHVVDASLGYFLNPLVTVLLGVGVLGERLRRAQWAAVGVGAVAIAVIAVAHGRPPWIALVLASSFGLYGLVKNRVGVGAVEGFAVETMVLLPPALAYLVVLQVRHAGTFGQHGVGHAVLLAGSGIVTGVPLLAFAGAARRLPLSTMGLLQYLTPVLQLACGVAVFHEPLPPARLGGFLLVWVALAVLTVDALRARRPVAAPTAEPAG